MTTMIAIDHFHRFGGRGWGWFGIVPIVLFLVLIGVAIWAVLRVTSRPHVMAVPSGPATSPPARPDGALEEVRMRYARGEISREEFVQRFHDLGGREPEAPGPAPAAG